MDLPKSTITETLELTCWLQIELQLHSTNQNGELRETVKVDGAETRQTMEEFHREMKEKVQAIVGATVLLFLPLSISPICR